jgi:hypothetical protein
MSKQLLLHVGLPKTGSTALQAWCSINRHKLLRHGINYPAGDTITPGVEKHQFLVGGLMRCDLRKMREAIDASNAPKILFSTEGLTNHVYDFSESSLALFRSIVAEHSVRLFIVLRDPSSWTRSYYKQAVINPPLTEYDYATPLDLESFASLPRTKRLTETTKLIEDLLKYFGSDDIAVGRYESNWPGSFADFLGVPDSSVLQALQKNNSSCSDDVVEIVRQINGMALAPSHRSHCLALIAETTNENHDILGAYKLLSSKDSDREIAAAALRGLKPRSEAQSKIINEALAVS